MNTGQFDEKSIGAMRATSVNSWWCLSIPRIIRASCFLLFCRSAMCSVKALELIPSFDKQWILWWVMQRSGAYSLNTMVGRSRLYSAMRSWRKYELAFADAALEIAHINHGIWNICIVFICADSNELIMFGGWWWDQYFIIRGCSIELLKSLPVGTAGDTYQNSIELAS